MIFRVRYQSIPPVPHVHCALYVARGPDLTFALCGTFSMRKDEFAAMQNAFPGVEFILEDWERGHWRPMAGV